MAEATSNVVGIKLQVSGAAAMAAEFKKASAGLEKFQASLKSTATTLAGIGAAFISFHALSGFFKAAQESAVATAQLEQALLSTGEGAKVTAKEFTDLADELQNLTGVSDEAIQDVSRLILEFTRSAEMAKAFTPIVLDMAAAMGTDAVQAAKELGKGLAGETISIRGFKLQAADATELLEKLTAAVHGQAAAAMRAKGPIEALRVQWGEFEEVLGGFLTATTGDFFQGVADGLKRLNAELKVFKSEHPELLAFLRDLGGSLGKLVSDNMGKLALGVAGLVGAGGLALLVTAFASISAPILIAAAAIAVLVAALVSFFAALNAQAIADWIGGIKIMGTTVQDYLVLAIKEAELAWVELKSVVTGGDFSNEIRTLTGQIAELTLRIHAARKAAASTPAGGGTVGAASPESMASRKEMLELAQAQLEIGLRNAETDQERFDILARQLAVAKELEAIRQKEAGDITTGALLTEKGLKAAKELTTLAGQRLAIEKQISDLHDKQAERTFAGGTAKRFKEFQETQAIESEQGLGGAKAGAVAGIQEAMMQLGTTAQMVGRAMTTFIGGAVDSIAGGIKGLLSSTMSWGQALRSIAGGILNSVVDAISRMFAEWIVGRLLVSATEKTAAASEAVAKAPSALLTSITSYGAAAAIGIAALLAAMSALGGGFQSGGFTGAGPSGEPAGVVHRGEYVVPAQTVSRLGVGRLEKSLTAPPGAMPGVQLVVPVNAIPRLGLDWFQQAAAGMAPGGPGADPAGGPRAINQKLNVYLDRRAWIAASRDDIEAIAIDAVARSGWRVHA